MDTYELQRIKNRYDIVGNNPALTEVLKTAVAVAPTDLTVLISGESGVGKEAIPRLIHDNSKRRNKKFLAVNCGAIPEGTINAELFGHEKGSFTGAVGERKGYFEEADGGTLFLDEIGELPKETQALLLRVLQNGEFLKVGSSTVQKTDVRIIAATNVDLFHAVSTGKFREDLYYRLNAIQIKMPSLRERKDDIYLLFRKFSSDFAEKYNLRKIALSHDAVHMLVSYRWPGNIRQLKNVAEALTGIESKPVTMEESDRLEIGADVLRKYIPDEKDTLIPAIASEHSAFSNQDKEMLIKAIFDLKQEVDALRALVMSNTAPETGGKIEEGKEEAEWQPQEEDTPVSIKKQNKLMLEQAIIRYEGDVKKIAEELGISERTVYRKLKELKKK